MADIERLPSERLATLIEETEITLDQLKNELRRREQANQSAAIDHLEDYMTNAELSLQSIRDFISQLVKELVSKKR
jgi:Mg2+ and Co2+ transporter CorA